MSSYFPAHPFGPSYQSGAPLASEDYGFPNMPQRTLQHSGDSNSMPSRASLPGMPALPRPMELSQGRARQNGSFNTFMGSNDPLSHVHSNGSTMYDAQVSSTFNSLPQNPPNLSMGMYHPSQPTLNTMSAKPHETVTGDSTSRQRPLKNTDMVCAVGSPSRDVDQELEDGEISTSTVSEPHRLHPGPHNAQSSPNPAKNYEYQIWNSRQESKRLIQQLEAWGLGIQDILAEVTESNALESLGREMGFQFGSEACAGPKPPQTKSGISTNHIPQSSTSQVLTTAEGAMESQNASLSTMERVAEPSNDEHAKSDTNVNVPHGAKPMDRKALIAQKLAARNVKPSPSPSNVIPLKQNLGQVTEQRLLKKAAQVDSNGTNKDSEQSSSTGPTERNPQDLEATRKFQTDLARQRMAALKQKALVKQNQPMSPERKQSEQSEHSIFKGMPMLPGDTSANAIEVPRISNPRSPTRKASYFSPVSQSPMFNIPGLFSMPETATKSQPNEQGPGRSEGLPLLAQEGPLTTAASSVLSDKQENNAEASMPASDSSRGHQSQNPRKRRRADDFFDSPPDRSKKSLMREDEDVVIDVSDDEKSLSNDGQILAPVGETDTTGKSLADHTNSLRQAAAEDGISPTNATVQGELPTALFPEGTPSGSFLPKAVESNGLKTKEMEIESMNRKIAELEANIRARKAKQAASRTQSPGGIASVTPADTVDESMVEAVSHAMDQGLDLVEKGRSAEESKMQENSVTELMETLDASVRSVPNGSSVQRDSPGIPPNSPKHLEARTELDGEADLDNHSASVPVLDSGKPTQPNFESNDQDSEVPIERLSVEESLPPSEIRQRRATRRLEIESGLPILDQEIEKRRRQLESLRAQEVEIKADIKRGVDGRQMLLDELSRLSGLSDSMDWNADRASPQKDEDHLQRRPAKGDQSGSYRDVSLTTDGAQEDGQGDVQATDSHVESGLKNQPLPDVLQASEQNPEPALPSKANGMTVTEDNEISDGDLDGDNMDISRSSLDEGEIEESIDNANFSQSEQGSERSDHVQSLTASSLGKKGSIRIKRSSTEPNNSDTFSQEHHSTIDLTGGAYEGSTRRSEESGLSEDLEVYEPPDELSGDPYASAPRPPAEVSGRDQHSPIDSHRMLSSAADVREYHGGASPNINQYRAGVQADPRDALDMTIEDTPGNTNSEDSDEDYEPAEPSAEEMDFHERSPQTATEQVILPPSKADANSKDKQVTDTNELQGHFEPYQSPLEKFRSYRYHPEYLSKVPSGFRSLTYSNAIDAETPICQYDLDGTCNDVSCQKQHFGKMNLSDDSILRDLARLDGAGAEEQDKFLTGLKTLIIDLRTRNVASMSDIATSIVAYRKQFLGDESRVLPL